MLGGGSFGILFVKDPFQNNGNHTQKGKKGKIPQCPGPFKQLQGIGDQQNRIDDGVPHDRRAVYISFFRKFHWYVPPNLIVQQRLYFIIL